MPRLPSGCCTPGFRARGAAERPQRLGPSFRALRRAAASRSASYVTSRRASNSAPPGAAIARRAAVSSTATNSSHKFLQPSGADVFPGIRHSHNVDSAGYTNLGGGVHHNWQPSTPTVAKVSRARNSVIAAGNPVTVEGSESGRGGGPGGELPETMRGAGRRPLWAKSLSAVWIAAESPDRLLELSLVPRVRDPGGDALIVPPPRQLPTEKTSAPRPPTHVL